MKDYNEVTTTQIDQLSSSTCKTVSKPFCPGFNTNVLNGQWICSLNNQHVPSNSFPDNVKCSLKCDGKNYPSVELICEGGTWKKVIIPF